MRENLEQGQKKELPQGNENISTTQTKQSFQSLVNSVTNNLEYMRMIMKDTEEYRELLEEQTRFNPQDSRLSRDDLRVRHKNLSRFRFSQLIEEIKKIFDLEVSFKSTYITVLEERYWKGKESVLPRATKNEINQSSVKSSVSLAEEEDESGVLYSDYEKLKRVLILLIENSLSYQKAGLIEIEVTEERYNVLRVKIIDNQYMKLSDEELKNINLKGSSDRGFGFAIITALLSAIKPQSVRGMALEIRKDSTNEKSNIVFWISKCLKDDSSNNNLNITTLGNISNNLHAEGGDKRKTDQSGFINGSLQQKAIDNLIDIQTKQLGDHNDANFGLPPQKSIPQFGQYKGVSQQQITSHLLLQPGKNKQPIAAFQLKLRQALINISAPSSFMDYYSAKAPDITSVISPKSYQGGGSLWNGIMTGKNKLQQEQQSQPLFLIVSDDFRTSASIHALLMKMCNNSENGVKFASNKTNLSDLLSKNIFEYIFIEELEGVNLTDIFIDINKNYKHRKQLQKVIFFDFHSQVQKNLEASIPLLESREINKEDAKSEFSLKLPFFPYPQNLRLGQQIKGESVKDSPHSGLSNNLSQLHQMNQGNLEIDDVVPQMMIQDDGDEDIESNEKYVRREEEEEETNHEKSSSRRSNSSSSSSQSKRSIPSENFANKKVKHFTLPDSSRSPKKQHKHKGQIKRPINDLEDEDTGRNSSQVDIPSTGRSTSRTNLQLLMRSNRHGNNNNIILHHRQSLTQLQDIPQDISGDNSMLLNNSTLVLKNSKVTKIQDRPPTSFSSRNFSRSFSEALQDPKKKQKLFGVPALKAQETIAQPHLAVGSETELNKVSDNSPHSTHTRSSYGHFSPSKNNNQTVSQNALRKSQYFRQEGAPNNTKTFIKNDDNLPTNFINNNTISQNQLRKYSNNTQHDTPQHNNGRSQDNIKYSFDPKYNESIEVASSLKFAYFSLEYPFGYAQIYEAICHMNFTNDLLTLNQNFFNLNRPELYNSRQYF